MKIAANIDLLGNQILNFRPQILVADPSTPWEAQIWYNSTDKMIRWWDSEQVREMGGEGGSADVEDATSLVKGILRLAGDLGGTADSPSVAQVGGQSASALADAAVKRHQQGTDAGTTEDSFQIDTGNDGPLLVNVGGMVHLKREDGSFAALRVANLIIDGDTVTSLSATTVQLGDNIIELNIGVETHDQNSSGGFTIKRLALDDITRADASMLHNESARRWELTDPGGTFGISRKWAYTFGDGSATTFTLTHNLNSKDVHATFRLLSSDEVIGVDWYPSSTNAITVTFPEATPPASMSVRAVIIG